MFVAKTPTDHHRHAGSSGGLEPDRRRLWPDEERTGARILENEGDLLGVQMEVDRNRGRPGEQPAQVGEHRLDTVLGEHRDTLVGTEVELAESVDDSIENVVDLRPAERHAVVAQRQLIGALSGKLGGDQDHQPSSCAHRTPKGPFVDTIRSTAPSSPARSGP